MFLEKVLRIGFSKEDEMRSMATWVLFLGFWGAVMFGGLDTSNILLHIISFVLLIIGFWNISYYEKDNPFFEAMGRILFARHKLDEVLVDVSKNSLLFVL